MKIQSLFIEGRAWFDKTYGNTYHSVKVWANGRALGAVGLTYGYETMYEYTAIEWLKTNGLIDQDVKQLWDLKRAGIDVYSVLTYGKKSELWKDDSAPDVIAQLAA